MNFQSICRVCIGENEGMISIFQSHTFSECYLEIGEVITNCASVQIHKSDGFPEYICKNCLVNLCLAYRFKQMCEESDYKFRNNLIVNNKSTTSSIIPGDDIKIEYNNVYSVIDREKIEFNTSSDDGVPLIKCEFDEEETQLGVLENQLPGENIDQSSTNVTKLHDGEFLETECSVNNEKIFEFNASLDEGSSQIKCEFDEEDRQIQLSVLKNQPNGENIDEFSTGETFQKAAPTISGAHNKEHIKINYSDTKYEITEINEEFNTSAEHRLSNIQYKFEEDLLNNKQTEAAFYKCVTCSKCFNQKCNLTRHMRIHTGEKPYKCVECGQSFTQKGSLNSHLRIHMGEKPHKCETCGQCFNDKGNLNRHMRRIHTGERKPHKCETCGQCFSWMHLLNNHMKIHTGEKPFKCETCGKCFNAKNNLTKHMRIHTGECPFTCEACDKAFTHKAGLIIHFRRIHTREKRHKCEICHKSFKEKCNLNQHIMIHTGEKPYSCKTCDRSFNQKVHLSKHMKIHGDGF